MAMHEYGIELTDWDRLPKASAIVAAVAHAHYKEQPIDSMMARLVPGGLYVDVKCQANADALRAKGARVWRL